MPTFQQIVLTDAATPTPVNHTLVPVSNSGGVAIVAESNTTKIGELRLEVTPKNQRGAGRKFLTDVKSVAPVVVVETVDGISRNRVERINLFSGTFSCAPDSTEQERKNLIAMVASSLAATSPLLYDTVVKVEGIYGG